MFSDPTFWVALAFIVFVLAIFNPIKKILTKSLDDQINSIKANLKEAENLKNEAQISLSNIKKRQNEVKNEIENIQEESKDKIKKLEKDFEQKIVDQISKRELVAKNKIDLLTREANVFIQDYISSNAIDITLTILKKNLSEEQKQNLINLSIKELRTIYKN